MKFSQIEAFRYVIKAGSISQAARQLHLTQPALSLQIKDLEDYFQVKLLERSNRGVRPTKAGGLVYYYGEKILNTRQTLWNKLEKLHEGADLHVAIGASSLAAANLIPQSVSRFQENYPSSRVQLTIANSSKIIDMLLDGQLDVAVTESKLPSTRQITQETVSSTLGFDDLVLVASPSTVRIKKEIKALDELYHLPMLIRENGSGLRQCTEEALHLAGVDSSMMRAVMEINCVGSIKTMLCFSHYYAFLSKQSVQKELDSGVLTTVALPGFAAKLPVIMTHPDPRYLSNLQKKFIASMTYRPLQPVFKNVESAL